MYAGQLFKLPDVFSENRRVVKSVCWQMTASDSALNDKLPVNYRQCRVREDAGFCWFGLELNFTCVACWNN